MIRKLAFFATSIISIFIFLSGCSGFEGNSSDLHDAVVSDPNTPQTEWPPLFISTTQGIYNWGQGWLHRTGGVHSTPDGGKTWAWRFAGYNGLNLDHGFPLVGTEKLASLRVVRADGETLATGGLIGFAVSADGGGSWEAKRFGDDEFFSEGAQLTDIALTKKNIVISTTQGLGIFDRDQKTWRIISDYSMGPSRWIRRLFVDGDRIVGTLYRGITESKDFGETWTYEAAANFGIPEATSFSGYEERGQLIVFTSSAGVTLSRDGGKNWTTLPPSYFLRDQGDRSLAFGEVTLSDNLILISSNHGVWASHDQGLSWRSYDHKTEGFPKDDRIRSIAIQGRFIAVATVSAGLGLSDNKGETWKTVNNNLTDDPFFADEALAGQDHELKFGSKQGLIPSDLVNSVIFLSPSGRSL